MPYAFLNQHGIAFCNDQEIAHIGFLILCVRSWAILTRCAGWHRVDPHPDQFQDWRPC